MMVLRSVRLAAAAPDVWNEVRRPRLLRYVAAPLQAFAPVQPPAWPDVWAPGPYEVHLKVLGMLPFGTHWIVISFPEEDRTPGQERFLMRDRGHGKVVKPGIT